ncbi:hypothetical protein MMC18_001891 [Xylographa bjoerkii]|nr:hypothetical protein [Xylographa bjoerkii]
MSRIDPLDPSKMDDVPGTVHLVDLEGTLIAKHSAEKGAQDIVLVPAPSNDPDDPLNWSPTRKGLATACMCVYTLMSGAASAMIYSVIEPIVADTGLTVGDLNAGTGYFFLLAGWGCLFWQPLALQYGKRPVYLISLLGIMGTQLWAPHINSNAQWIASRIVQGFFTAPIESLCEITVADLWFTHQRGRYMALYALFIVGSNSLAPVLAGFIDVGQGWQWVLYWSAIWQAIGFIFLFFFMEETNYNRQSVISQVSAAGSSESLSEKGVVSKPGLGINTVVGESEIGEVHGHSQTTYLDKLKLFRTDQLQQRNELLGMVIRPLKFLSFPVIFFAGFTYGANLVWFNVLNGSSPFAWLWDDSVADNILGTVSLVLASPPYNFAASSVGLSYLGPLIGTCIASAYTGFLGDWILVKLARRNNGIAESEHRLWLLLPQLLLLPFGLILWGVGAAHNVHWFGLIFGIGTIGCMATIGCQVSINYCIDSYRALGGDAIVTVILVRNTMSFAIGYGLTPWVTNMGLQNAFIVAAFAAIVQAGSFLVMIWRGKKWRISSVPRYLKYVEVMRAAGMIH